MSTCMEASRILARKDGPHIVLKAVALAIQACRCDIETECTAVQDGDVRWWDTASGLFDGNCDNDIEFRQMRTEAVLFLDQLDQIEHHPEHHAWVRFVDASNPRPLSQLGPTTATVNTSR